MSAFRSALTLISVALLVSACASAPEGDVDRTRRAPPGEARGGASVIEDLQAQLSDVEQRLALTPQQRPLWDRYREAVGALMADQMRLDPRPVTRIDALKQIGRKVDVVRNRLVAMEDIADAAEHLYGVLDADQRRVADRVLPGTVPALYSGLPGGGAHDSAGREARGERGGGSPPGGRRERAQ